MRSLRHFGGGLVLVAVLFAISVFPAASTAQTTPPRPASANTLTELGVDDFQISMAGGIGDSLFDALSAAVAYNNRADEYLVAWEADDNSGGVVNNEFEIFAQRFAAADGEPQGELLRLSRMGPDGDSEFDAFDPAIAYNSQFDEYLVVWSGDDNITGLVNNELEVFAQRVAADGTLIGERLRVSNNGPAGDPRFAASRPRVAYNSQDNRYLVVWEGDDDDGMLLNDEFEIYGQNLIFDNGGNLQQLGLDFRISAAGGFGNLAFAARSPTVVYNTAANEYLVAWEVEDSSIFGVDEYAIFGQRLDATTAAPIGTDDFLISQTRAGFDPALAYNSRDNQYLVVWAGDDTGGALNGFTVFGQLLTADGSPLGANSGIGVGELDAAPQFSVVTTAVAYAAGTNEYLVAWEGGGSPVGLAADEIELFAQRVRADGSLVLPAEMRLSSAGPDGDADFAVNNPALAYSEQRNQFLLLWHGEDDANGGVVFEDEIFGQRVTTAPAAVTFSQVDYTVQEGDASAQVVEVVRSGDLAVTSVVQVTVTSGTATAGADYGAAAFPQALTFLPGIERLTLNLQLVDDSSAETSETITFDVTPLVNVAVDGVATATVTIADDDTAAPAGPHTVFLPLVVVAGGGP